MVIHCVSSQMGGVNEANNRSSGRQRGGRVYVYTLYKILSKYNTKKVTCKQKKSHSVFCIYGVSRSYRYAAQTFVAEKK